MLSRPGHFLNVVLDFHDFSAFNNDGFRDRFGGSAFRVNNPEAELVLAVRAAGQIYRPFQGDRVFALGLAAAERGFRSIVHTIIKRIHHARGVGQPGQGLNAH